MFFLNPARRSWVDGKRRASHPYWIWMIVVAVVLLISLGLAVSGVLLSTQESRIYNEGSIVTGVLHKYNYGNYNGDPHYQVYYGYDIDGQSYQNEVKVDQTTYEQLEDSGEVEVYYLPGVPDQSRIQGQLGIGGLLLVGIVIAGVSLPILMLLWFLSRRHTRFYREARVVRGEIMRIMGRSDDDDDYLVEIAYQFRAPDTGETLEGKSSTWRNDLQDKPLPAPGTPVAVLYMGQRFEVL